MVDFKQEVTPANETTPSHSNLTSFSFRAEGILLAQSRGRLIVVNYFNRRMLVWLMTMLLSTIPLNSYFVSGFPPLSYWTNLFHHANWQTMLSAVSAAHRQLNGAELFVPLILAMLYWLAVLGGLNGVVLDRRNSTAKAAGRTRPLTSLDAVRVVATRLAGQPGPSGRRWGVRLLWSDEHSPLGRQELLPYKDSETSFLGYFPLETDADRFANAIAEFAGVPVHHQTFG